MKFRYAFTHLYIICFNILICNVYCHTMEDAKKLLADKTFGYEKNFRPVMNQSNALEIYVGFELVSIREFDEVKEQLTISAIIPEFWIDEYMTWNPKDYGDLDQLVIESDNVWTPNLVLVNNVDKLEKIGDTWQLIRFYPNGLANYYPGNVLPASCRVDVTYYPWDRQKCSFTFTPWAQVEKEIIFKPYYEKVLTSYYSENGAWTFYDSSVENAPNSLVIFSLYLERKPLFVLVNVILPIIFMTFLNTIIYAIPIESGERISYSITVLLALAVFLTLVGENLPKTSSPMSFFSYYLLVVLIISLGITLSTIFNVRLFYKKEDDPVPDWISSFVRCLRCECRHKTYKHKGNTSGYKDKNKEATNGYRYREHNSEAGSYVSNSSQTTDSFYNGYKHNINRPMINGRVPHYISSLISPIERDNSTKEKKEVIPLNSSMVSWKNVSLALDIIFFTFFFSIITIATIVFFACISAGNKD